jgi:hypothetical protein
MLLAFFLAFGVVAFAQEMEPRAYSRAPVGTNYLIYTYGYQAGDILTDSSTPLQDVSVKLHSISAGYGHTFNFFGRQGNIGVFLPLLVGRATGTVFEQRHEVSRSGIGDMRVRFSANLIGGPALSPKEFAAYKPKTTIGASLTLITPTGEYDPRHLVNLGSNRWAFKPEIGISKPMGRWTLEAAGGVWLFTENSNFFGSSRREQAPLLSLQGHVVYTFKPRMWLATGATFYRGGHTIIDGIRKEDSQSNSRIGATFSYPIKSRHSIKLVLASGLTTRFGGKLRTIAVGWQYSWF